MITQSKLNGPLYLNHIDIENGKEKLMSKALPIPDIKFGYPQSINIHMNPYTESILLERVYDDAPPDYRMYTNNKFTTTLSPTQDEMMEDTVHSYYYGIAEYATERMPYLIQNEPPVSIDVLPDYETFTLPPILSGYPYEQTFTYSDELLNVIGHLPATYTDRYKRPINASAMNNGYYFPTTIDKVTTPMRDLVGKHTHYPIVVRLNDYTAESVFVCLDLEPGYTDEELEIAESYDVIYKEETPRGGKHYLARIKDGENVFKYRISTHLEAQINCQITFYGINGQIINPNAEPISLSKYEEVGNKSNITAIMDKPPGVDELIARLEEYNVRLGSTGKQAAKRVYVYDKDDSHADFMALLRIYRLDILPNIKLLSISDDALPWVLAGYAQDIIPARLKHADDRAGVPYLVYIANKIIGGPHAKNY